MAGRNANTESRERIYGRFYEQIIRDPRTNKERPQEEKVIALGVTLTAMREENLAVYSSPEARFAHIEIDSYHPERDNLRQFFEMSGTRTRQEHAKYLNDINQEARDLYEHGATIYENTLIVPREANSSPQNTKDKVRIGSLSYAAREFAPFVGEEKQKRKPQSLWNLERI